MNANQELGHLGHGHHGYGSYWKRAHHDWRFWVGVVCMFVAMSLYVMRDQSVFVRSSQPQRQPPGAAGK